MIYASRRGMAHSGALYLGTMARILAATGLLLSAGPARPAAAATLNVPAGGYSTISAAVSAASEGDTINVAAGTYNEQLNITKGLTIVGDEVNPDNVVIDGENSTSLPSDGQVRIYNPTGPVVFKGFKIINGGTRSGLYVAILTKGDQSRTIQNCKIIGHGSSVALGDDYGMWAYTGTGALVISDNYFHDMYHGILLEQQYGASMVENNTFDALVTGLLDGVKYGGRAIEAIVYGSTDVTSLQTVKGNQFVNFVSTGVLFSGGFSGQTPRKFTNVVIEENNFDFATTDISNLYGAVCLKNVSGTANDDPAGGVSADIHDNVVHVPSGNGIIVKGLNGTIKINRNSIARNLLYGLKADESLGSAIDATCNWWGHVSGPTNAGNPGGLGNSFVGTSAFSPWLVYGTDADATAPGLQLPGGFTVTAGGDVSAADNDYRRLANALGCVQSGQTVTLSGTFDWRQANASTSWALGVNGVSEGGDSAVNDGAGDDYEITVPPNVNNVTLTAASLGTATIQGPGDLPGKNLEGVFDFEGGPNQDWTISNLRILDFDIGIIMEDGSPTRPVGATSFNGTTITNNYIRVATDSPADSNQNIAIHFSFGSNQHITNNVIDIPGDGTGSDVGMQSNTSGGAVYDGLLIDGNTVNILNAQSTTPETIRGIWENGWAHQSNITVSNNRFVNLSPGNNPIANRQIGFRVTSQSDPGGASTVTYSGNTVEGANVGLTWYPGGDFAGSQPIQMTSNTIAHNATGMLVQSNGVVDLTTSVIADNAIGIDVTAGAVVTMNCNRVLNNAVGIKSDTAVTLVGGVSAGNNFGGNTTSVDGSAISSGTMDARNNWWGCSAGPPACGTVTAGVDASSPLTAPASCAGALYVSPAGNDTGNYCIDPAHPCLTIQYAVDQASPGDTIIVAAGTYSEAVNVTKAGLTIQGAGVGATIVDVTGKAVQSNIGVYVGAANVTLRGFTVQSNNGSQPRYGVKVATVDGVTLDHLLVQNVYRTGVDVLGATHLTISNVESRNNGGAGLFLTDVVGAAISNITTSGNAWSGMTVATWGRYSTLGTSGIVISGTNSFGEDATGNGGLQLEEGNYSDPGNPRAITWSNSSGDGANVTIQGSDFAYALGGPQDDGQPRRRFYQTLAEAQSAAAGSPDHFLPYDRYIQDADNFGAATNFYVYDVTGDKMSIQAAVNAASAHDAIHVDAGTYNESQIGIAKGLTLQGAGASSTVIDGGGGAGLTQPGTVRITAADNVTVDGFTVQNPKAAGASSVRVGIDVSSVAAVTYTITHNHIFGTNNPSDDQDYGFYAHGGLENVVFQNNEIHQNGANPILIERHPGATDVSYNVFDRGVTNGTNDAYFNMNYGGADVTSLQRVSNNTVDMGNDAGPFDNAHRGFAITFAGAFTGVDIGGFTNVQITDNAINNLRPYRRGIGLWNNAPGSGGMGDIANALIQSNSINGSGSAGSIGVRLLGLASATSISKNFIDATETGVQVIAYNGHIATGAAIQCNRITDNTIGLRSDTPSLAVNDNVIAGNGIGVTGAAIPAGPALDVTDNYWGCADGPGAAGCDVAVGNVQTAPYASAVPACTYCGTDAECDDGLTCNGTEVCNPSTHMCQSGTPANCSGSDDTCNVGTCTEPDGGCVTTSKPDGTACVGDATCEAGVCIGGPSSFVVFSTRLEANTSTRMVHGVPWYNGSLLVTGLVNDNDTGGMLATNLQNGVVSLEVWDSTQDFHATVNLRNCRTATRRGHVYSISCLDKATKTSAVFRLASGAHDLNPLYNVTVRRSSLSSVESGSVPPSGPVQVILHQGAVERSDTAGVCGYLGRRRILVCK